MDYKRYMSVVAGAAASIIPGVDEILPLPRYVHWAVAGAATDAYSQGEYLPQIDQQLLMCAAGGAIGGFALQYFL